MTVGWVDDAIVDRVEGRVIVNVSIGCSNGDSNFCVTAVSWECLSENPFMGISLS